MASNPKITGYETANAHMYAYAEIFRKFTIKKETDKLEERIAFIPSLIVLNSAILEGAFRSALVNRITADIIVIQKEMTREEVGPKKNALRSLERMRNTVELTGSWNKLISHYKDYLGKPINHILDQESPQLSQSITNLMTLRNVCAHGTSFISSNDELAEDDYGFDWNNKLDQASKYIERTFSKGDFYENLAHPEFPRHFLDKTKLAFSALKKTMSPLTPSNQQTITLVNQYFGGSII